MNQTINLTDEQQQFRSSVRQFAADKYCRSQRMQTVALSSRGQRSTHSRLMELTAVSYPIEYGGSGASLSRRAGDRRRGVAPGWVDASTSLMFMISKLGMLPVLNFGSEELKSSTPTSRESPPASPRRATDCRRPTRDPTSPR